MLSPIASCITHFIDIRVERTFELVGQYQPIWYLIARALGENSYNDNHLLKAVCEAEAKIANQKFYQRALQQKNCK